MAEKITRSKSSAKNAMISLIYYFISNIFTFIMRTFLINNIGIEYAGLNSLLINIIGMLNIAELGLSTAVGYSLYKPIADNNYKKMNEILCLYKYLYRIIAVVIAIIGLIITLFISSFVTTNISINEVRISFLLYLVATVISYLLTFLNVLPSADQKNYIVVKIQNNGKILKNILQLASIVIFKSFYIWLVIEIISSIVIYIYTNIKIKKMYTWYEREKEVGFKELIKKYKDIVKRTKDLVFHRIGGLVVYQTDNILISKFDNLTGVGVYSNYMTIYTLLTGLIEQVFMGITASIGNLIIEKTPKEVYNIWKEMYVMMLFVTALFGFLFYKLANPFIAVWVGEEYMLSLSVVFAISINIMFRIIKNPIDRFKEAYGIFWDVYAPIAEALINLVFSIVLAMKFGLIGIVIGTIISNTIITFVWKPYIIFKHIFKEKLIKFFIINAKYIAIDLIGVFFSCIIMNFINFTFENKYVNLILMFVAYGLIAVVTILLCFMCDSFFRKTLKKYKNIILSMVSRKSNNKV